MLSRVKSADLWHDVVLVLAGNDKYVGWTVALEWPRQVELEQIDSKLADVFVDFAYLGATHSRLVIRFRIAGVSEIDESFGYCLATGSFEEAANRAGWLRNRAIAAIAVAAAASHRHTAAIDTFTGVIAGAVATVGRCADIRLVDFVFMTRRAAVVRKEAFLSAGQLWRAIIAEIIGCRHQWILCTIRIWKDRCCIVTLAEREI